MKCSDFILETDATTNISAGSDMTVDAGGDINQQAGGNYTIEASTIFLN